MQRQHASRADCTVKGSERGRAEHRVGDILPLNRSPGWMEGNGAVTARRRRCRGRGLALGSSTASVFLDFG